MRSLVIEELSPATSAKVAKCRTRVYTQVAARPRVHQRMCPLARRLSKQKLQV